jgi:hypothetical protein
MLDGVRVRLLAAWARLRRIERRELRSLRRWVETTNNLLQLTVVVVVPLLIGLVTLLSNAFSPVFFLVYPPLAAGAYTLFADPEGKYSSPGTFVGGMTLGALAGLVSLEASIRLLGTGPSGVFRVSVAGAALAIFLTATATWLLDFEEPAAFSTALLILLVGGRIEQRLAYVVGVAVSSTLVAAAFALWRNRFYERRARYLYRSTNGDDHVLVPMRDDPDRRADAVEFAGVLAGAHDAGKVVLLDIVEDGDVAAAEATLLAELREALEASGPEYRADAIAPDDRPATASAESRDADRSLEDRSRGADSRSGAPDQPPPSPSDVVTSAGVPDDVSPADVAGALGIDPTEAADVDLDSLVELIEGDPLDDAARDRAVTERAAELESLAARLESEHSVPCQVVVVDDRAWSPRTVERAVVDTGCDLVVSPYDPDDEELRAFTAGLFALDEDVVAFRSETDGHEYDRALVAVRKVGSTANAMLDFARRATGPGSRVSVCHCITTETQRRAAERMLANLVDAFPGEFETRVPNAGIEEFLEYNAPYYDLVFLGASTDRSAASRLVSRPTFERLDDLDADVAIVHRGR